MDAIRKAGGTKNALLKDGRKIRLENMKKKKEEKSQALSSGGDLMGDLSKALTMRRKGISGSKSSSNRGGSTSGTMDRISAMIPTLVPSTEPENDDWD